MTLELLFLGTGTSAGVPMVGCECDVCRSHDPRDQRTRPSVLIRYPANPQTPAIQPAQPAAPLPPMHETILPPPLEPATVQQYLIDTSPELRTQMIRHEINRLDGVLYTHTHADHVFGIDDLRRFNAVMKSALPIYAEQIAMDALRSMFNYIFEPHKNKYDNTFVPQLVPSLLEAGVPIDLGGVAWTPVRLLHGRRPILGFRVDYTGVQGRSSLAYCTDVSSVPPESYPVLEGLDVLVIDALRYRHHPTHMTVDQALATIDQLKPRRAYLTHIAHDIQHADLESQLPEHVYLAFDGLTVDVPKHM